MTDHASDNYDAAIADLMREISDRMRTVNSLLKLKGQEPKFPDLDTSSSPTSGKIRSDQWYTAGLSTAGREFLTMRGEPADIDQIYNALISGSFQFEARDAATAKAALKQSLTKNTTIFHRLPSGHYGLSNWYPNRKNDDQTNKPRKSRKHRKASKPKAAGSAKRTIAIGTESNTLVGGVKEAIAAMHGEFTKADILAWLEQHRSGLKPRRTSVFSMVTGLRDEMGLVTAKESKGREPSTYRREKASPNGQHNK